MGCKELLTEDGYGFPRWTMVGRGGALGLNKSPCTGKPACEKTRRICGAVGVQGWMGIQSIGDGAGAVAGSAPGGSPCSPWQGVEI